MTSQTAHNSRTILLGGVWVETFIDTAGKNYAGIGYTYDAVNENFIAPQPYPSWTLDSNDIWQPPVPQPPAPPQTYWDEQLQEWIPYEPLKKLLSRIDKSATRQLKAV
jgi:hypothetical protein